MLSLVPVHGVFWSALLSSSAAYMTGLIPESRRAEGIGYWGFATIGAIAVAPPVGLWLYRLGWGAVCAAAVALNLTMACIAWQLRGGARAMRPRPAGGVAVLGLAVTLFLYSFGYGGITSFRGPLRPGERRLVPRVYFTRWPW
jgi:hypothetical protein